ncbi:hypothetical protein HDU79_009552 [Rhizoclosmatium sp. JEL0117]|nr:hypothetical protein HDU99_007789 [Rhizoclosmatium hyalinum]KAJ3282904.1 hypothetical protein HDU79_009552 [Rhizoclosmatium sp. JEL0117]
MVKTVIITGSSRGIGKALTEHYVQAGWNVIATARKVSTLDFLPASTTKYSLDTSSESSINAFAASLGNTPVDLLINNAGILVEQIDKKTLMDHFETNAVGPFLLAKSLFGNLKAAGGTAVVANISSEWGSIGGNSSGQHYAYRASKSALNSYMKSLSLEWKSENISVLLFCPGWVQTDMGGAGAAITTSKSAAGLSSVIDKAFGDLNMTGSYLRYDGSKIEW